MVVGFISYQTPLDTAQKYSTINSKLVLDQSKKSTWTELGWNRSICVAVVSNSNEIKKYLPWSDYIPEGCRIPRKK